MKRLMTFILLIGVLAFLPQPILGASPRQYDSMVDARRERWQQRASHREQLVAACDGADGIVAYNAGFERTCIRALAAAAPHLRERLEEAEAKLLDPLRIVRDYVYHPDFLGRFGLKHVLPVLVPELGYDDLAISQGELASLHLSRLLFYPEWVPEVEREGLRRNLLAYCKRDTMATVALLHKLRELAGATGH